MEHYGKYNGPEKVVERQQAEKKLNLLSSTNIDNDTQCCTVQDSTKNLRNDPKDSKPDSGSDSDSNLPTVDTENNRLLELIREILIKFDPLKVETDLNCPFNLLLHSKGSINVSKQEFENIIYEKTAEIITLKSFVASQMTNAAIYEQQQNFWIQKFKDLLNYVNCINAHIATLDRKPKPTIRHVRNVGTNVSTPENDNPIKQEEER